MFREAFLASPVGRATEAWEAGDTFFEIQLEVGDHRGEAGFGATQGEHRTASSGRVLGEIEGVGWVLEHVGYTYMMTGQTSSERMFASGEATAISGKTLGIYLFRNPTVARPGPAPAD
jgi:hypothetical protein